MVTGSDWFQLFFPKGVLPDIKLRVPIILASAVLGFCVGLYQIWLYMQTCILKCVCMCAFVSAYIKYITAKADFVLYIHGNVRSSVYRGLQKQDHKTSWGSVVHTQAWVVPQLEFWAWPPLPPPVLDQEPLAIHGPTIYKHIYGWAKTTPS